MGFVKDIARTGALGLAGLALPKKKTRDSLAVQPTMISSTSRPTSMISRGGY